MEIRTKEVEIDESLFNSSTAEAVLYLGKKFELVWVEAWNAVNIIYKHLYQYFQTNRQPSTE